MEEKKDKKFFVARRAGCCFIDCKPIFSSDSKLLLCAAGEVVKVLGISSGKCVRQLIGHESKISSLQLHPTNQVMLLTSSLDKSIIKWDYVDGVILKKYLFTDPILSLVVSNLGNSTQYILKQKSEGCSLMSFDLDDKTSEYTHVVNEVDDVPIGGNTISVFKMKNKVYAASVKKRSLSVCVLGSSKSASYRSKSQSKFTCIAKHPVEFCLATGHEDGVILLWRNFMKPEKCVTTKYHWHSLPVGDLIFSPHGSYMLSGGHESVLVKWTHNTECKDTLPRLGSGVMKITCSPDNSLYALCHTDNRINIIASNFEPTQVYQGLTRRFAENTMQPFHVGLHFDPITKALVTNGRHGHLQFYKLDSDELLFHMDIVGQNFINSDRLSKQLIRTEIENIAFSDSGKWLATVERRDDGETTPEMRIRFWLYEEKTQRYVLNTSVIDPHFSKINSTKFIQEKKDRELLLVTVGDDKKFKIWEIEDDSNIYRENFRWNCRSVGYYQDRNCRGIDFSSDGSLLAIAFDSILTLWSPEDSVLCDVLTNSYLTDKIKEFAFGQNSCFQYILCSFGNILVAWNLLSLSISWSLEMNVSLIIPDLLSEYIAVFSDKGLLNIFHPSSSKTVFVENCNVSGDVISAKFIARNESLKEEKYLSWLAKSQLLFMTSEQEIYSCTIDSDKKLPPSLIDVDIVSNVPETPFSQLMRRDYAKLHISDIAEEVNDNTSDKYLSELLLTPNHAMPPIRLVCQSFLDQFFTKKKDGKEDDEDSSDEEMEQESDSSSDAEMTEN